MTPTNPNIKVIESTPHVVIHNKKNYKLSNMEGKLNSKYNDTHIKFNIDSLNKFVDVYKFVG